MCCAWSLSSLGPSRAPQWWQRKETLAAAPLHPDNKEAHAMLAGGMSERGAALEAARAIDFDEDKDRDSEAEEEDLLSVIGAMMAEMASMPHVGLH
jgi:hypothetical protein